MPQKTCEHRGYRQSRCDLDTHALSACTVYTLTLLATRRFQTRSPRAARRLSPQTARAVAGARAATPANRARHPQEIAALQQKALHRLHAHSPSIRTSSPPNTMQFSSMKSITGPVYSGLFMNWRTTQRERHPRSMARHAWRDEHPAAAHRGYRARHLSLCSPFPHPY